MRWILLIVAIVGFAIAFTTKSPAVLGIALVGAIICSLAFVLALAAERISSNAQPESMLIIDPEVTTLRTRTQRLRQIQSDVRVKTAETEHKLDAS